MRGLFKFCAGIVLCSLIIILFSPPASGTVFVQRVNLKAVGDIMVHDVQYRSAYNYQTQDYDFLPMFKPVLKELEADLLIGNLETTLSGEKLGYSGYPRFNSPDNIAVTLKEIGFNFLFTANNHSLDKGEYGLVRTLEILDKLHLNHTGTFADADAKRKPSIIKINGISFGFLNYTYGTNGILVPKGKDYMINYIDESQIEREIKELIPLVDMVIVGFHFGNEYWRTPSDEQRKIVLHAAQAGADIILGAHPHVLQPYEFMEVDNRQVFVVYSLGNFVSGQKERYRNSGAILNMVIEKSIVDSRPRIISVDFTPVWVRRYVSNNRLRMEVVPSEPAESLEIPLTELELRQASQVAADVNELWQPVKNPQGVNSLLGAWANNYLPVTDPKSLVAVLIKYFGQ
ncbi:MAG: CapA family protein [Bacillota bacterium]